MAFKTSSVVSTNSTNQDRPKVDFAALENYIIETVECEQPETLNGVVVGIIDLGNQVSKDSEYDVDKGDEDLTIEELTEKYSDKLVNNFEGDAKYGKITKFDLAYDNKLGKKVIKKFVKQKPQQCITYVVDFPDILVDKSKFYTGESNPLPLRLYAGGSFYNKYQEKEIIQNPIQLKWSNINTDKNAEPIFSLSLTSQLHKMAVAAKIVKSGEAFEPTRIDELLGKTLQFKVQVGRNEKGYYFEKLNFVGAIQKKDNPFENVETFVIQFDEENDVEVLSQIRRHVYNTASNALNWEGSSIQKQALEVKPQFFKEQGSPSVVKKEDSKVLKEGAAPKELVSDNDNNSDDDEDDWS